MRFLPLLLNVILVVVALLVYDTVRDPSAPDVADPGFRPHAPEPAPTIDPGTLVGRGDTVWRDALERRLATLEQDRGASGAAASGPLDDGDGGEDADLEDLLDSGPLDLLDEDVLADGDEAASRFTPHQLRTFRALLETVEAQRSAERSAARIDRMLERAGVQLTKGQREDVARLTLDYQERVRQALRDADPAASREERRTLYQAVRDDYRAALESVVPTAEADAILQQLSRAGAGRRRTGR